MAEIRLRNVDDALVARLKERARQNHRTLSGEVKAILEAYAPSATPAEMQAFADRWQRHWASQGKRFSDSAELIRRTRDALRND